MKRALLVVVVSFLLLGLLTGPIRADVDEPEDENSDSRIIVVDCQRGERIARALRRAKRLEGPVEIEIRGMCDESVLIDRPYLTLRGSDPAIDGIRGDGRLPDTVMLDTVWEVRIESLSLVGLDPFTRTALGIGDSFSIDVVGSRLEGTSLGLIAGGSNLVIEDSTLIGGFAALHVSRGTAGGCFRCTLSGGAVGRALRVEDARFAVENSSLDGGFAVVVRTGGAVTIRDSALRAHPDTAGRVPAVSIGSASQLTLRDSSVEGTIFAADKSLVQLFNVAQRFAQPSPESHGLRLDSVLRTFGTTTLEGDLLLSDLARAILGDGTTVGGALACDPSSEAHCLGSAGVGGSNCGGCPVP